MNEESRASNVAWTHEPSVLCYVVVCCSVLQCIAVCCSVLQCIAVCCSVLQCVAVCCSVLQSVTVCCSVLQSCNVTRTYETPYITGANRDSCYWQRSTHMSTQRHDSLIRDMKYSFSWQDWHVCPHRDTTHSWETWLIHERHDSFSTVCLVCAVSVMTKANTDSCHWQRLDTYVHTETWLMLNSSITDMALSFETWLLGMSIALDVPVAVYCSVLQCLAVCCSVLQCLAVSCSVW